MTSGFILALATMFLVGLNDFIIKILTVRRLSIFSLSLVQNFWALPGFVIYFFWGKANQFSGMSAVWGLLCGATIFGAMVALYQSLIDAKALVNVSVFRLNFVVTIVLSLFLPQQELSALKGMAILVAVLAIAAYSWEQMAKNKLMNLRWLAAAFILGGLNKFFLVIAAVDARLMANFFVFHSLGVISLALPLGRHLRQLNFGKDMIGLGTLSFLILGASGIFIFLSLERGDALVTIPVSQMSFAVTSFLSIVVLKEKFFSLEKIGFILAMISLFLFAWVKTA